MEIQMAAAPRADSPGMLRTLVGTAGVLFCHCVSAAILATVFLAVVPRYLVFYDHHSLSLPSATKLAIYASFYMSAYWYLAAPGLALDGVIYFLLARLPRRLDWLATAWAMLIPTVTVVVLGWAATALYMPLETFPPVQQLHGP